MSKPKVLISDKLSPAAVEIFKTRGIDVDVKTSLTPQELLAIIKDYDGLAVRSNTKVTAEVLAAASSSARAGNAWPAGPGARPSAAPRMTRSPPST